MIPGIDLGITAPGKFTPYPIVSQTRIFTGILYSSINFINFHTKRNHKSVNIRSRNIFQMTSRTNSRLHTLTNYSKIMFKGLFSRHFQLIKKYDNPNSLQESPSLLIRSPSQAQNHFLLALIQLVISGNSYPFSRQR